jgi:hypothetical protein
MVFTPNRETVPWRALGLAELGADAEAKRRLATLHPLMPRLPRPVLPDDAEDAASEVAGWRNLHPEEKVEMFFDFLRKQDDKGRAFVDFVSKLLGGTDEPAA